MRKRKMGKGQPREVEGISKFVKNECLRRVR